MAGVSEWKKGTINAIAPSIWQLNQYTWNYAIPVVWSCEAWGLPRLHQFKSGLQIHTGARSFFSFTWNKQ